MVPVKQFQQSPHFGWLGLVQLDCPNTDLFDEPVLPTANLPLPQEVVQFSPYRPSDDESDCCPGLLLAELRQGFISVLVVLVPGIN